MDGMLTDCKLTQKNPIRPVPITSHTPTLIFFKKRHFDRNYSCAGVLSSYDLSRKIKKMSN